MKAHIYFSHNPKNSASKSLYLGQYSMYSLLVYQFWFPYVFTLQPHPQWHIHVSAPGEKIRTKFMWNLAKCVSQVKVNQLRVKHSNVKMGTTFFNDAKRWHQQKHIGLPSTCTLNIFDTERNSPPLPPGPFLSLLVAISTLIGRSSKWAPSYVSASSRVFKSLNST